MADASLYYGQTTDTPSECHGARLTSGTPPTSIIKSGVSVENVPSTTKKSFVLRISYCRIQKAKDFVDAHQQEYYVLLRHKQILKGVKRRIVVAPFLPSSIFVHATSKDNIIPVTSEHIQYKFGDNVVITDGEFQGIRGRVVRIAGQQRVIVELFDGCMVATAYIPKKAKKRVD